MLALAALPFSVALVYALTSVFGTPTVGLRCVRSAEAARCEVLQSRFPGLPARGGAVIAESEIGGVETLAPLPHAGRGSGEYSVSLVLRSGPYRSYAVLHSHSYARAEAAARKLSDYFASAGATSIEVNEDPSEVLVFLAPLAILAAALVAVAARRATQ